jgi:hypothetical protein
MIRELIAMRIVLPTVTDACSLKEVASALFSDPKHWPTQQSEYFLSVFPRLLLPHSLHRVHGVVSNIIHHAAIHLGGRIWVHKGSGSAPRCRLNYLGQFILFLVSWRFVPRDFGLVRIFEQQLLSRALVVSRCGDWDLPP